MCEGFGMAWKDQYGYVIREKIGSEDFSYGVTPSTPHHCVVNDPGNDSKNSSST
jgi:hypothetical protein